MCMFIFFTFVKKSKNIILLKSDKSDYDLSLKSHHSLLYYHQHARNCLYYIKLHFDSQKLQLCKSSRLLRETETHP